MSPRSVRLRKKAHGWRIRYLLWDGLGAWMAYTLLYAYRKTIIEPASFGLAEMDWDAFYQIGALLTALLWVGTIGMVGLYLQPLRKSRLKELARIVQVWMVFCISYFIFFLLDDFVDVYKSYFKSAGVFSISLLCWTIVGRIFFGYLIRHRIKQKKFTFPTLLVGDYQTLEAHLPALRRHARESGELLTGWISVSARKEEGAIDNLPLLGDLHQLVHWIKTLHIEDVVVALPSNEHTQLTSVILDLEMLGVRIFMLPDTYGILSGMVGIDEHGVPLIEWHLEPMDPWQRNTKRVADILISLLALTTLFPLLLLVAIRVQMDGGKALYRQERLGKHGKIFHILKFRSMKVSAETSGPQLSKDDDPRITSIGRILRKYRLYELPQFWNVLTGDMSLVGPRPERAFYAEQILEKAPQYRHIYKVQPGITSWGMVRFGYASTVEEMVARMEYDLVYIENMSFFNDIKVGIYTVWTILQGRGK